MARTFPILVSSSTPTPLQPAGGPLTTRRRVLVTNHGGNKITVGYKSDLALDEGHVLAQDQSQLFESGDVLYALASVDDQAGGVGDYTAVSEME